MWKWKLIDSKQDEDVRSKRFGELMDPHGLHVLQCKKRLNPKWLHARFNEKLFILLCLFLQEMNSVELEVRAIDQKIRQKPDNQSSMIMLSLKVMHQ